MRLRGHSRPPDSRQLRRPARAVGPAMKVTRLPVDPGLSGWNEILPAPEAAEVLEERTTADFLVIGGGYAGLAATRRLSQLHRDARIVLLEARRSGEGPAGALRAGRGTGGAVEPGADLREFAGDGAAGRGAGARSAEAAAAGAADLSRGQRGDALGGDEGGAGDVSALQPLRAASRYCRARSFRIGQSGRLSPAQQRTSSLSVSRIA